MLRRFLVGIAALIMASTASAQVTYSYTGNRFLYIGGCCGVSNVSGSFTVSSALAANTTYNLVGAILNYHFSDGRTIWTPSNYPGGPTPPFGTANEFTVSTDASGNITSWQINIVSNSPAALITTQSLDFAVGGGVLDATNVYGNYNAYSFAPGNPNGQRGVPGTWTSTGASISCADVINNSIVKPSGGSPTISAQFTPRPVNGTQYTVAQAAKICGFLDFNWVQTIIHEVDPNRLAALNLDVQPTVAIVGGAITPVHLGGRFRAGIVGPVKIHANMAPYSDPPQGGGYTYNSAAPDYSFPFYCDLIGDPVCPRTVSTLSMSDTPTQTCMVDAAGNPSNAYLNDGRVRAECGGTARIGSNKNFVTHLAGVKPDGLPFDLGIGFTWISNYNGTAGGVTVGGKNGAPPDPGSGTGGVTVTSHSSTSHYSYGIGSAAKSQTLLDGSMVRTITSGLTFSRSNQNFNGSATITNIGSTPLAGPFHLVLVSLPAGVNLQNSTGIFGSFPYITLPDIMSLTPGQSATAIIQFKNPAFATITFAPMVYAGSLE